MQIKVIETERKNVVYDVSGIVEDDIYKKELKGALVKLSVKSAAGKE